MDRYFEGKILPNYIHFVCAVIPSRRLNIYIEKVLDALNDDDFQDNRKNLVYKVGQMPESYVPYLFPTDPDRNYGSYGSRSNDRRNDNEEKEEALFDIDLKILS